MAEYRTMEEIRAEADCEYHVYWEDLFNKRHMDKIIANDHEDAKNQFMGRHNCYDVYLVLKGDFLVLWQG